MTTDCALHIFVFVFLLPLTAEMTIGHRSGMRQRQTRARCPNTSTAH